MRRALFSPLALRLSVLALWVLPLGMSARAGLNFNQSKKNALQAQKELSACKLDEGNDKGTLSKVSQAMASDVATTVKSCDPPNAFQGFVDDFEALMRQTKTRAANTDQKGADALLAATRLQVLKNALMTYLDAEYRYNLNAPKAQGMKKVETVVGEFCQDPERKSVCTEAEKQALREVTSAYRKDMDRLKVKALSPDEAKNELNRKLEILNQAYKPAGEAKRQAKDLSMSKTASQSQRIDGVSNGMFGLNQRVKMEFDKAFATPLQQQYFAEYMREAQSGVGILLYTDTLRKSPSLKREGDHPVSIKDSKTVIAAINELKAETLSMARKTNAIVTRRKQDELARDAEKHSVPGASTFMGGMTSYQSIARLDPKKDLRDLMRRNPVAVGQVLVQNPGFAGAVCALAQEIEAENKTDKLVQETLEEASQAGMVVGGVMMVTGVLAPAGATILQTSRVLSTLSVVNNALNMGVIGLHTGYAVMSNAGMKAEISANKQALMAHTGGDLQKLKADEAALDAQGKQLAGVIAKAAISASAGKIAKFARGMKAFKGSKAEASLNRLGARLSNDPFAQKTLPVLQEACGQVGADACGFVVGALHRLPRSKQAEVLRDRKSLEAFIKEEHQRKNDWYGISKQKRHQKETWEALEGSDSFKKLSADKKENLINDLYRTHADTEPGTLAKKKALVEMRQKLVSDYGFSEADAKRHVMAMGDARILGEFKPETHDLVVVPRKDGSQNVGEIESFGKNKDGVDVAYVAWTDAKTGQKLGKAIPLSQIQDAETHLGTLAKQRYDLEKTQDFQAKNKIQEIDANYDKLSKQVDQLKERQKAAGYVKAAPVPIPPSSQKQLENSIDSYQKLVVGKEERISELKKQVKDWTAAKDTGTNRNNLEQAQKDLEAAQANLAEFKSTKQAQLIKQLEDKTIDYDKLSPEQKKVVGEVLYRHQESKNAALSNAEKRVSDAELEVRKSEADFQDAYAKGGELGKARADERNRKANQELGEARKNLANVQTSRATASVQLKNPDVEIANRVKNGEWKLERVSEDSNTFVTKSGHSSDPKYYVRLDRSADVSDKKAHVQMITHGVPVTGEVVREKAFYVLDQEIGTRVVPEAGLTTINGKKASYAAAAPGQHIDDLDGFTRDSKTRPTQWAAHKDQMERMATVDLVGMQTDRHGGNFLYDGKTSHVSAIDNELSLPIVKIKKQMIDWAWKRDHSLRAPISGDTRARILKLDADHLVRKMAAEGIEPEATALMRTRIETLKKMAQDPNVTMIDLSDAVSNAMASDR